MERPHIVAERLSHILMWGRRVASYFRGMSFEVFAADTKTQDAVIRCLEVIGEAASHILKVEPDFEVRYPQLELAAAYRAQNRTSHGYGSVDLAVIWRTATVDCPAMVAKVEDVARRYSA